MINDILNSYRSIIEKRIDEIFSASNLPYAEVLDASRYSLTLGGKRIRPIIAMEFCKLCGGVAEDALDFAIALEMVHTYSLIHDDLPCMDNDDMRRGKPSCHIAFGEDIALLAGDTLLTESFKVLAMSGLSDEKIVNAVKVLSNEAGLHGMIGGQVLDLSFEHIAPTAEELGDMYSRKTGALLSAAAKLGCIAAGKCSEEYMEKADLYSKNLGLAFQVIDDILDCTADEKLLGKPVGSDKKNQKTTFVTIYGIDKARQIATDYTNKALEILNSFNGEKENLKLITEYLLVRNY